MQKDLSRRTFVAAVPSMCAASLLIPEGANGADQATRNRRSPVLDPHLLSQDPKLVKETVAVSHGILLRVRDLVEASLALAKAARDWGFGDWETALGAASHTGRLQIAELLIAHGARSDIFTFAMFGQLGVVKAYVEANPGIQRTLGPHGITLLSHARATVAIGHCRSSSISRHSATRTLDARRYCSPKKKRKSTWACIRSARDRKTVRRWASAGMGRLGSSSAPTAPHAACSIKAGMSSTPPAPRRSASASTLRTIAHQG